MQEPKEEKTVPMYCISDRTPDIVKITPEILKRYRIFHVIYVTESQAKVINERDKKAGKFVLPESFTFKDLKGIRKENLIALGYLDE